MAKRRKRRRVSRSRNVKGLFLILCVVLILCGMVTYKKAELNEQRTAYAREKAELEEQIDELEAEGKEIENQKEYTKSKQFVEEIARDKLNLIYPGEIIFEPED